MIKLTKMLEVLGMETKIIVTEAEAVKLYSGTCGECTKEIWGHAYVKNMEFNTTLQRYIIDIRYM